MSAANILGFLQDIVKGAREFKKSLDFIDQSADDRGRVKKEGH